MVLWHGPDVAVANTVITMSSWVSWFEGEVLLGTFCISFGMCACGSWLFAQEWSYTVVGMQAIVTAIYPTDFASLPVGNEYNRSNSVLNARQQGSVWQDVFILCFSGVF